MKKIFKMFVGVCFWWFLFSTVNYIWPANGVYAVWNMYKASPEVVGKIFMIMALGFISACYGYMVGKDEAFSKIISAINPKDTAKKLLEANKLIDKMIDDIHKNEED